MFVRRGLLRASRRESSSVNESDILEALANLDYLIQNITDSEKLADYRDLKAKLENSLLRRRSEGAGGLL